jgi:hypothetical protein
MKTINEECKKAGIAVATYYRRRKQGLSHKEALSVPDGRKKNKSPVKKSYIRLGEIIFTVSEKKPKNKPPEPVMGLFRAGNVFEAKYQNFRDKEDILKISAALANEVAELIKQTF